MAEFCLVLPVILLMVMGMIELGFAINHDTSIGTATRQGARVGSELVNGSRSCGGGVTPASNAVDPQIIAAVEGVLVSPGSSVDISQVTSIKIFLADPNNPGQMTGSLNEWIYSKGGGPTLPGASAPLDFKQKSMNWDASQRCGSSPAPTIGVQITYTYNFITPLGALMAKAGWSQIVMTDQTLMAMEPPTQ